MNFFERQHEARRNTGLLVLWFVLAVVLIVLAINVVVYFVAAASGSFRGDAAQWLDQPWWVLTSLAVLAVIALGSLLTYAKVSGGGKAVAEMADARAVDPATSDPDERRLVNVVEEMSIASGTPVPDIYVMEGEEGINAFVAGLKPTEAVLVVTRGALRALDRDQLQGVVGHEYSHILNGDMRLNVRLLAVLAGILVIGQLGGFVLRSTGRGAGWGGRRGRGGDARVAMLLLGLGVALLVTGYMGLFFGRLIKAAASRQREFLADASSVQFTRNPDGIAGALWKIREHAGGSLLASARAEDMSHMCFGQSVRLSFGSLLATHPPLDVRIRRIDPTFTGRMSAERIRKRVAESAPVARTAPAPQAAPDFAPDFAISAPVRGTAAQFVAGVGNPGPEHAEFATRLHAALPPALLDAAHASASAPAVVYALILAGTAREARDAARRLLESRAGADLAQTSLALCDALTPLGSAARLPVLDLALPALRRLPAQGRTPFLDTVEALIRADDRFSLFEFSLLTILRRQLSDEAGRTDRVAYRRFDPVLEDLRLLLTVLARAGERDRSRAQDIARRAMASFDPAAPDPAPDARCTVDALGRALERLALLAPLLKRPLLEACVDCVLADGEVRPAEAELLRAVALSLHCPLPPMLAVGGDR